MLNDNIITLDFRKKLGSFALELNCTLEMKVTAFLGASGSGKSTLLNCMSGILAPDNGTIMLGDEVLFSENLGINVPPEKRSFGYVLQEGHLFPHLTVLKNIRYGQPRNVRNNKDKISRLLDILDISDVLHRYPNQLSGGQRQRVALARALAMEPRLLLMDEPLASLDSGLKNRIIPYLHHIKNAYDVPILYITHSLSEAMALADEAYLLSDGKISASGEPYQLLTNPSALPIAKMAGVQNILTLPVANNNKQRGVTELKIGSQHLTIPWTDIESDTEVPIAIRAEDIIISLEPNLPISARNILKGTVEDVTEQTLMCINVEGQHLSVKITHDAREQLKLCNGKEVYCVIKANAINLLWED